MFFPHFQDPDVIARTEREAFQLKQSPSGDVIFSSNGAVERHNKVIPCEEIATSGLRRPSDVSTPSSQ
jgi:hypothetical protein